MGTDYDGEGTLCGHLVIMGMGTDGEGGGAKGQFVGSGRGAIY